MPNLKVLKQNINQGVFVSMIRALLPEEVLFQLEILNRAKNMSTVESLRVRIDEYVTRMQREKMIKTMRNSRKMDSFVWKEEQDTAIV